MTITYRSGLIVEFISSKILYIMKNFVSGISFLFIGFILSCAPSQQKQQTTSEPELEQEYLEQGAQITSIVFQNLSGKLKEALTASGVGGAVEYCNLAASPLVDSLSRAHTVRIKRTSDRLRNPANAPSLQEREIIEHYSNLAGTEILPAPQLVIEDQKIHYYAPIFLLENCLKCHGVRNTDITTVDYEVISRLYPDDRAYDFKVGDLRGIWSLEFEKDK